MQAPSDPPPPATVPEKWKPLYKVARRATPGPWEWFTGCSWLRLGRTGMSERGNVLTPMTARDGHPDLDVSEEDQRFIEKADPTTVLALISEISAATAENARLREALDEVVNEVEGSSVTFVAAETMDKARAALAAGADAAVAGTILPEPTGPAAYGNAIGEYVTDVLRNSGVLPEEPGADDAKPADPPSQKG